MSDNKVQSRDIDYAAWVRKLWGKEWNKPDTGYEFGNGRTFEDTTGIYSYPRSWTSSTGEVWTLNGDAGIVSGSDPVSYLQLSGATGNYASTPDSAAVSIVGDIEIQCDVVMADWTPPAIATLVAKDNGVAGGRSYGWEIQGNGSMRFFYTTDGVTFASRASTAVISALNGTRLRLKCTVDVDNGASGHSVRFYTSLDGVTWTQLGGTVTTAGTIAIFDGVADVTVGRRSTVFGNFLGKIYRAQVYDGIDGTLVADMNPADLVL
jgi:hypothetical protein